ncbi:unnamed protein product [Rotaria socialis]
METTVLVVVIKNEKLTVIVRVAKYLTEPKLLGYQQDKTIITLAASCGRLFFESFVLAALSILKSDLNNSACAIDLHSPWAMSAGSTYGSYKFNVLQHLTEISPYFEYNSEGLNPDPPQD